MKKIVLLIGIFFTFTSIAYGDGIVYFYDGPYKGKVVELETGEPIEGVVVAARWLITTWVHTERICDAKETVTDKNGEFKLPKGWCISHPFAKIDKPSVVVFKPGYLGYPPLGASPEERRAQMPYFSGYEFRDRNQYQVIRLGRPKTKKERELTHYHAQGPLHDETMTKLPHLIRWINEEGRNLGFGEESTKIKK